MLSTLFTSSPLTTPWNNRLPMEWTEAALLQDWICYLDPSTFLSWIDYHTKRSWRFSKCFHPRFSSSHKSQLELGTSVEPFSVFIPTTWFFDRIDGLEYVPHLEKFVRVYYVTCLPYPRTTSERLFFEFLAHEWKYRIRRAFSRRFQDMIDWDTWIFRTFSQHDERIVTHASTPVQPFFYKIYSRIQSFMYLSRSLSSLDDHHTVSTYLLMNLKYKPPWYTSELIQWKEKRAKEIGEWTLLPYLSIGLRNEIVQKGFQTMHDIRHDIIVHHDGCSCRHVLDTLFSSEKDNEERVRTRYLHRMTWVQTCPHAPDIYFGCSPSSISQPDQYIATIDFEWIPGYSKHAPQLYLIGVYIPHLDVYKAFWVRYLHWTEEWRLFQDVRQWLQSHDVSTVMYYFAESRFISQWEKRYSSYVDSPENSPSWLDWKQWWDQSSIDVYTSVFYDPIIIKHSYTGKLKDLHSALFQIQKTQLHPLSMTCPEILNGSDSIQKAKLLFWNSMSCSPQQRPSKEELYRQLQTYNQFDCQALAELVHIFFQQSS